MEVRFVKVQSQGLMDRALRSCRWGLGDRTVKS